MYGNQGAMAMTFLLVVAAAIVVWLVAVALFVSAAKKKGHYTQGAAVPWLVGIFLSPLMLALYVCALPDRGAPTAIPAASAPAQLVDELPAL
uniref:Uncharacterized protein n=1 Tax=Muribaculaceae bacterium Z82 TaxID=2304548 RepID=A0A7C9NMM7_9BACT